MAEATLIKQSFKRTESWSEQAGDMPEIGSLGRLHALGVHKAESAKAIELRGHELLNLQFTNKLWQRPARTWSRKSPAQRMAIP